MNIVFDEGSKSFHLYNKEVSYRFSIEEEKYLAHRYWGKYSKTYSRKEHLPRPKWSTGPNPEQISGREFSLATLPQEYPGNDSGDYRESAFQIRYADESFVSQLEYTTHQIVEGKPELKGLPHAYVKGKDEAKTLIVTLEDHFYPVEILLYYTIYRDYGVITRSVEVKNKGTEVICLEKLFSMSVDFMHSTFDLIQLPGAWARERDLLKTPLVRGVHKIDSKRGTTHHSYQPFIGLSESSVTEHRGEIYGVHFIYTGEFVGQVEVDEYNQTRIQMGMNPEHFSWQVKPQESFVTPEIVMVYSDKGLNGMSQTLHHFYQHCLIRTNHQYNERPVLINNWEATYFDFTEEKIEEIAEEAQNLGIELFVLDDGWFGHRDNDDSSLGDWYVYDKKLPNGLKRLADKIHQKGMKFGLWVEPEMISKDSQLYKDHPEWVLQARGRKASRAREQYILDFSQEEVRENIIQQLRKILNTVEVDYIKWDYNRNMTEHGTQKNEVRDGEVVHRNILGVYEVMERLVTEFPNILWESCSGGGGRYDPGMLYYMPQTWTSDNTDAGERVKIQYGTSLLMPISSMGAHVSAIPNHQVGRNTSLQMRADVAMAGNLGYELDITLLSEQEKEEVKEQIRWYKEKRQLIQYGNFYRLLSPFDANNQAAWMFVDKEKEEAVVFYYLLFARANNWFTKLRLAGLDREKLYQLVGTDKKYYGDELMQEGVIIDPKLEKDFSSTKFVFKVIKE
jgi:alpha-galactosidase